MQTRNFRVKGFLNYCEATLVLNSLLFPTSSTARVPAQKAQCLLSCVYGTPGPEEGGLGPQEGSWHSQSRPGSPGAHHQRPGRISSRACSSLTPRGNRGQRAGKGRSCGRRERQNFHPLAVGAQCWSWGPLISFPSLPLLLSAPLPLLAFKNFCYLL